MINKKILILTSTFIISIVIFLQAWTGIIVHGQLATQAETRCIHLPKPCKERCKQPIDWKELYKRLQDGAAAPDSDDGWDSPKHSYNPALPLDHSWDFEIRRVMEFPETVKINRGGAIDQVFINKNQCINLLKNLGCDCNLKKYYKLWYQFGKLSHYCSDVAILLHAYSFGTEEPTEEGIKERYHEGDMDLSYHWYKGTMGCRHKRPT